MAPAGRSRLAVMVSALEVPTPVGGSTEEVSKELAT